MIRKSLLILPLAAALFLACVATGPGGKTSLIIIPSSQEVSIGAGMAQELARSERIFPDSTWQRYLNRVGQNIVAVCDRKDIQYHFTVVESDQINAFAAPGGFIYFYTGLLREMDSEAEMAAVVAHEISHVVARHGIKRLQATLGVAMAYELALGNENSEVLHTAVGLGLGLLSAGYSRSNEREADDYGLTYLVRAGYDPQGMEGMLQKLAALGGRSSSSVFEGLASTHPQTQERIQNTRAQIARMNVNSSNLTLGRQQYQQMRSRLPQKGAGQ
ncbi:MAG: M48 family metalloprotease [bacterium]|nr:M48 family metalloprotease [bacterium]